MKVTFVTQPYDGVLPPNQNSIGLIVYNTAVEMARQAQVTLYAKRRSSTAPPTDLPFRISYVAAPLDDLVQDVAGKYPRWAQRLGLSALADAHNSYARGVRKLLDREAPEIVHVMNYWAWSQRLKDRRANHPGRRRIVLEMQSEWLSQMDPAAVARQMEAVDAVVAVSDHIGNLFKQAVPSFKGQVATAYNGVDTDQFVPTAQTHRADRRRILFVGRVSPEKGVHTLLDAFALIAKRNPDTYLDIAGPRTVLPESFLVGISSDPLVRALARFYDGSLARNYQEYLDQQIARHGLGERIRFLGAMPHKQLVESYRDATIVVNPSLSESFGISIVEGMSSGVPVIATRVGGMLETVLHDETGLLVNADQPHELADAMQSILADPQRARSFGVAGRQRAVERFSWRARVARLIDLYARLLS